MSYLGGGRVEPGVLQRSLGRSESCARLFHAGSCWRWYVVFGMFLIPSDHVKVGESSRNGGFNGKITYVWGDFPVPRLITGNCRLPQILPAKQGIFICWRVKHCWKCVYRCLCTVNDMLSSSYIFTQATHPTVLDQHDSLRTDQSLGKGHQLLTFWGVSDMNAIRILLVTTQAIFRWMFDVFKIHGIFHVFPSGPSSKKIFGCGRAFASLLSSPCQVFVNNFTAPRIAGSIELHFISLHQI